MNINHSPLQTIKWDICLFGRALPTQLHPSNVIMHHDRQWRAQQNIFAPFHAKKSDRLITLPIQKLTLVGDSKSAPKPICRYSSFVRSHRVRLHGVMNKRKIYFFSMVCGIVIIVPVPGLSGWFIVLPDRAVKKREWYVYYSVFEQQFDFNDSCRVTHVVQKPQNNSKFKRNFLLMA